MTTPTTDTMLLTRDHDLMRIASEAVPEILVDWRLTFSAGLSGITPATRTLIVDAEVGAPMAHLMAALFLDQAPGRTAVVVQPEGATLRANADPRVTVLERPLAPEDLRAALDEAEAFERACRLIATMTALPQVPALAGM